VQSPVLASKRTRRCAGLGPYRAHDERAGARGVGDSRATAEEHRPKRAGHRLRFALLKQARRTTANRSQAGNAPLQAIFAIALFMILAMGVVQVAMFLYGRNIVAASAHEAARAAAELGRTPLAANEIAKTTIRESAGRLLDDVAVDIHLQSQGERTVVVVDVTGRLSYPGPLPFSPSITARASASKETAAR
jgi:hypothetical protein